MERTHSDSVIPNTDPDSAYFIVSTSKFKNLYLLTFGFYGIYWFYQQWKLQQPYIKNKIHPALRSIFAIFFTHSLVKRIKHNMDSKQIEDSKGLTGLATIFVVLSILASIASNFLDTGPDTYYWGLLYPVLFYLSALPLVEVQEKINILKNDPLGEQNSQYKLWQVVVMVFGGILWFFAIIGMCFPQA